MTTLTPSQLDQLVMQQTLMIEMRQELDNVGEQHRIDLLSNEPSDSGNEPGDSGDESWPAHWPTSTWPWWIAMFMSCGNRSGFTAHQG